MMLSERPWEENHHRSFILPPLNEEVSPLTSEAIDHGQTHSPSTSYGISTKGNLSNISKTITIDVSVKLGDMETIMIGAKCTPVEITLYRALFTEFYDIFTWSYEEIPDIDPWIIVHEIKTYAGANSIRQKLRLIHPKKAATIKAKVKKLLKVGFIYLVPLTEWVSNIVPITTK